MSHEDPNSSTERRPSTPREEERKPRIRPRFSLLT
ncbi:unnamed protein product [Heterosigma akashiwo]